MNNMRAWMGLVAHGIQILAVLIMVTFIVTVTARWLMQSRQEIVNAYAHYRVMLGRSLLLGLELLVAADIIETAAVELSLANLKTLGALVVVRTALSWTLTVEVEGRWPWQTGKREAVVE
jgi:uncharacterized membrane protein